MNFLKSLIMIWIGNVSTYATEINSIDDLNECNSQSIRVTIDNDLELKTLLSGSYLAHIEEINLSKLKNLKDEHLQWMASNSSLQYLKKLNVSETAVTLNGIKSIILSKDIGKTRNIKSYFILQPSKQHLFPNQASLPVSIIRIEVDQNLLDDFNRLEDDSSFWNYPFMINFRTPIGGSTEGIKILYLNDQKPPSLR